MKKYISIFTVLCMTAMLFVSCFDDDSTAWENNASDITISGIAPNYTAIAFEHEHLTINPTVKTSYSDSEISYKWVLINSKTGTLTAKGDTIQPVEIGTEKNLDYEVAIAPGEYQLRLYAQASNGYETVAHTMLTVQTNFSQGFYILKETADGNTELDLLNNNDILSENLLTGVNNMPLTGKPLALTPSYNINFINPDNDDLDKGNAITLSTESGDFCVLRTSDLKPVFNRSNIRYEGLDVDEIVYGFYTAYAGTRLLTSKGLYKGSSSTGQLGLANINCACSPYYFPDIYSSGGGTFWDAKSHSLTGYNFNMVATPLTYSDGTGQDVTQNLTNMDCLHCGYNYMQWYSPGTGIFVMRDNITQERYLYLTTSTFRSQFLKSRNKLNPSSHMAKATYYATNGMTAALVYCIDGGKIYACVMNNPDLSEIEINPEGIPSGENIVYVADQFWNQSTSNRPSINYLIVGTQNGNTYKLYFYETNGGAPVGKPAKTVEGTGLLKKVRYMNPTLNSSYLSFYIQCYNAND